MKYDVIHARELSPDLAGRWTEIQQSDSTLASPYFCPEFTKAVAAVRDDVHVGILEDGGRIVGFFPFNRTRGGVARPIGLGLSDYHGVIVDPNAKWTAEELMRGCNLVRWEFDHLLASQKQFAKLHSNVAESPIIDVSQGIEAFESSRDKSGRKQLREAQRKREKLEKQVGPVSFTLHTQDQDILRQLFEWKSLQCQQTGTVDFFALRWCVELIEHIHATQGIHFGGILSCLHVDDTLAAVHFVMYSRDVWHSWFPAYNDDLREYSPGLLLLFEMIKTAADRGIQYIDLGKGISLYKKRVMTGGIPVAEGCLEVSSLRNQFHHFLGRVEQWSPQSALKPVLTIPGRMIKRMERKKRYE